MYRTDRVLFMRISILSMQGRSIRRTRGPEAVIPSRSVRSRPRKGSWIGSDRDSRWRPTSSLSPARILSTSPTKTGTYVFFFFRYFLTFSRLSNERKRWIAQPNGTWHIFHTDPGETVMKISEARTRTIHDINRLAPSLSISFPRLEGKIDNGKSSGLYATKFLSRNLMPCWWNSQEDEVEFPSECLNPVMARNCESVTSELLLAKTG